MEADTKRYWEGRPVAALRRHVTRVWALRIGPGSSPVVQRVVPDGCMDIIWLDGNLVVAGPDTVPVLAPLRPRSLLVGVRFRPGLGPALLGVPAAELLDSRPDLELLWGREAARMAERLAGTASAAAAMALLQDQLVARLPAARQPDPLAEAVVAALRPGPEEPRSPVVARLTASIGHSERQLHRRCLEAFGYGPKTLDRILRFQRFLTLARQGGRDRRPGGLARLAADSGYADQAHLSRECRSLGGLPPRLLLSS